MPTKMSLLKPFCAAALLCAAAAAQADITVYTSQAEFLAAVQAPGVDTYDDLTVTLYGETLTRSAGAYTYNAYSATGLYGAGGDGGDFWLSNNTPIAPIVFSNFSGGVSAFGGNFFGSDVLGQYTTGNLILTAIDGSALSYGVAGAATTDFLGFVSTVPLAAVTIATDGGVGVWPTANNVVLAVPEPATYGMLLAGLGLVGLMRRRSR
ncbi:PEP-CTERM sorting domain-containing protein [Massilia sp. 2TAF26]|uniref:PEP-CTERM sorting domain-containing protein n=1 Tax=Massilia sp. 2TAF26 TaxID=3233012 RepID=UPI003F9619AB